jgi:cytochrome c oxidase subunit 2
MKFPLLPPQASTTAHQVDALYFGLVGICGLVLLLILFVMIYFLFKYRRGKPIPRKTSIPSMTLEIAWTTATLIIFMGFFGWGAAVYYNLQEVPAGALEINIVGKQWMWKIQHPNGSREIDELHVPIDRAVKLTLASEDVIHSFFIPAFRIKQDVVPGRYTTEWFKATQVGTYHLYCAEFCGKDHSRMRGTVYVMKQQDYDTWLTRGQSEPSLIQAGERLFRDTGCSGCHMGSGVVRAPRLEGLFGRPVPLQTGGTIIADDKYIHDSIVFPEQQIAAGYANVMPSFKGRLTEEELFELRAYIKSLNIPTEEEEKRE